ncbi:MAG TPA: Wzz/FepE/Etk N-terminal domain-containing protein [Geminicoccus sp.]|jgi:capsular polysaccharide biosynthesis protein|uniref:Wzz/FepE/Etk N-terminal domain-containing protein n=1 Tax=Geminicoccus sp. TaxID=2024832 RepID=UPI002E32D60C|nr:Wzz/FepE/Etk N-terminal domain-containing protein [Geminicoccus sp.]HEX2526676.1 Wzz/FepE/Etk N-terminal domain-containing protein [Geminicoccus sp.]
MVTKERPLVGLAAFPDQSEPPFGNRQSRDWRRLPDAHAPAFAQAAGNLWRRKFLILASTILGMLLAAFLGLKSVPQYTSDAMVLVVPPRQASPLPSVVPPVAVEHGTVETESRVIASRANIVRALARLDQAEATTAEACIAEGVWNRILHRLTTEFGWSVATSCSGGSAELADASAAGRERRIEAFQRRMQSMPSGQSALVSLSFTSGDPRLSQAFLDAVIASYLDEQLAQKRWMAARASDLLQTRIDGLTAEIERAGAMVAGPPGSNDWRREIDRKRAELDDRLDERVRLDDQLALLVPDARAISPASPGTLASPSLTTFTLLGLIGGLTAGCMLAFTLDRFDTRLRSEHDLEEKLGATCIGLVPEIRVRTGTLEDSLRSRPGSLLGRAVRGILASIAAHRSKVVLVTSSLREEGASSLASALAAMAADGQGARVLLIASEATGAQAGRDREHALVEAVRPTAGSAPLPGMILRRSGPAGYDLMYPEPYDHPPVLAPVLRAALPGLRTQYDLILIDVAPVLVEPGAASLTDLADLVLLVVRWGRTDYRAVRRAMERLSATSSVATVLSRVEVRKHRRYGYFDMLSIPAISRGDDV